MNRSEQVSTGPDRMSPDADPEDTQELAVKELSVSSAHFERRSKINRKMARGDWWIALGVYLMLVSFAVVVL